MKRLVFVLGIALVFSVALSAASVRRADISGKWTGTMHLASADGSMKQDLPTEMDVTQEGSTVTGKIGDPAKPSEMLTIKDGKMSDDELTIAIAEAGQPTVKLTLKLADGKLSGDGTFEVGSGADALKFTAKIELEKK